MRRTGREEQAIRLIQSNLLYIVVAAVIIALIVLFNFSRQSLLAPIRGGSSNGLTLEWKVSDQTADTDPEKRLLVNQLEGADTPKYDLELPVAVIALERDNNGDLVALPRFQGELEYCTTNNPSTCAQ